MADTKSKRCLIIAIVVQLVAASMKALYVFVEPICVWAVSAEAFLQHFFEQGGTDDVCHAAARRWRGGRWRWRGGAVALALAIVAAVSRRVAAPAVLAAAEPVS